jgi:hypothetical protein
MLVIRGRILDSSINYGNYSVTSFENILHVMIYGKPALIDKHENRIIDPNVQYLIMKKSKGDFFISIPLNKEVTKVIFGNNNTIIWERKSDEILENREKLLTFPKFTNLEDIIFEFNDPDGIILDGGYSIFQYNLMNYRKAILKFYDEDFPSGNIILMNIIEVSLDGYEVVIF